MILPNEKVVVVGAGCFGVSTAYHLLKRGFTDITVLDRSFTLPAPDAASTDLNKIVRSSYADEFYATLANEAIHLWKDEKEWGDAYHESGILILGSSDSGETHESYANDAALGARLRPLHNGDDVRGTFPSGVRTGSFDRHTGYMNYNGGWANASQGLSMMISKVVSLDGKVVPGKAVSRILRQNGKTTGVQCSDGSIYSASMVILAIGAWTASGFPELGIGQRCLATGQCIVMLQLTNEEVKTYRGCPVVLDFKTGFYVFPPNEQGIMKAAVHAPGYTHTDGNVSTPRTISNHPETGLLIPNSVPQDLRRQLREIYPDLAEKPFIGTRLCWYNDSHDGDWIIGPHPDDPALIFATAGSGHAYKFLPVIGRLVADAVQGKLEPQVANKFAFDRLHTHSDSSRTGLTTELDLDQLCTPEDLLPR